ncbi:MAG: hypothetical protein ACE3JP_06925 [Ectobacillus sp.]
MLSVFGVLVAISGIALYDMLPLFRSKQKRELWTYMLVLLAGTALIMLQALHFPIPSPLDWLTIVWEPAAQFIQDFLGVRRE